MPLGSPRKQIAELADDANAGEVEAGRYAVQHATDARVRQFAEHMVSAHGIIGREIAAVAQSEMIVPLPSTESEHLSAGSRQTMSSLESQSGPDFNRAYIDGQVKAHEAALDLFADHLIPQARDPALMARLEQERLMIVDHPREARDVQKSLGSR